MNLEHSKLYREIKDQYPEMKDCFFAFSEKQFEEGLAKYNLQSKDVLTAGYCLYGTEEGLANFKASLQRVRDKIAEQCQPQDVYDYEFENHECGYICDDEAAIKIVVDYFGVEKAKEVKRKFAFYEIKQN